MVVEGDVSRLRKTCAGIGKIVERKGSRVFWVEVEAKDSLSGVFGMWSRRLGLC